jgi:hypothetical protein
VGKKNWLFMGSETTGQRAATIYTMVECAKRHGHDPEVWLADVLERLPAMTNRDDLGALLPSRWQRATAPPRHRANRPHGRGLPGRKRRSSSATYTPVYATAASEARSAGCPSIERLPRTQSTLAFNRLNSLRLKLFKLIGRLRMSLIYSYPQPSEGLLTIALRKEIIPIELICFIAGWR